MLVGGGGSLHGGGEFTNADAHFDPGIDFFDGVVVVGGEGDVGVATELYDVVDAIGDARFELSFGADDFVDFAIRSSGCFGDVITE